MPASVVKTKKDEAIWKKAKIQAKEQGQEENYAYVMSIYKSMGGSTSETKKESVSSLVSHLCKRLTVSKSEAELIESVIKDYVQVKKIKK